MKLWVDDHRAAPRGWRSVRSVAAAKVYLEQGTGHAISASITTWAPVRSARRRGRHIGRMTRRGNTFYNYCRHVPSGYDLCLWMEQTGRWPRGSVRVHSANPAGARRMLEVIERSRPRSTGEAPSARGTRQQTRPRRAQCLVRRAPAHMETDRNGAGPKPYLGRELTAGTSRAPREAMSNNSETLQDSTPADPTAQGPKPEYAQDAASGFRLGSGFGPRASRCGLWLRGPALVSATPDGCGTASSCKTLAGLTPGGGVPSPGGRAGPCAA